MQDALFAKNRSQMPKACSPLLFTFIGLLLLASQCIKPVAGDEQAARNRAFLIAPYLQPGSDPGTGKVSVSWGDSTLPSEQYRIQWRRRGATSWLDGSKVSSRQLKHSPVSLILSSAEVSGLPAGQAIEYRILEGTRQVFASTIRTSKTATEQSRFAVFGDCGCNSAQQKALAHRMYEDGIDYAVITGDLVYGHGRVSEYLRNFFPAYNADQSNYHLGAPLMRSVLFFPAPGNHDLFNGNSGISGDFNTFPDGLAYYLFWKLPLNGPDAAGKSQTPIRAAELARAQFLSDAADNFPRMASYSFDYGNAHWTVLDSNPYVDWQEPSRAAWLESDLKAAAKSKWRFVAFHHPAFHSGRTHSNEEQMRWIAPLLEKYNVDVVFNGHVHNYQRTVPLKFTPRKAQAPDWFGNINVHGEFELDKSFDGMSDTTPRGPVYIVSGTGGAPLNIEPSLSQPEHRRSFTAKYAAVHSYTRCEINKGVLLIRQITADGVELDSLRITKK